MVDWPLGHKFADPNTRWDDERDCGSTSESA